jgi:DNA-binding MarR family transcriptional regulator
MDYRKSLIGKLSHISHNFKQIRFSQFEEIGLYPGQPRLLHSLAEKDGISQRALAQQMNITPATLTRMLQRMEKNNLIIRKADEKDQRIILVYMTDTARETLKKLDRINEKTEEDIFGTLNEDDREKLTAYLDLILDRIHEIAPHHDSDGLGKKHK